ncbi:MAG TPA: DUF2269 family protein [Gaiellaceae bacterium]|nr:DUF2269 family protein [Gaiellaceae bacterium]
MESTSAVQVAERGRSWITPAIGLALVGAFLLFAFKATDTSTTWFGIFKLVHVAVAVFWVGGGVLLTALAIRAERADDPEQLATIARQATFVGEKLFAPSGGIVFAMGIAMVVNQHVGFGTTWVDIGLAGWAISFITGIGVLAPRARRLVELFDTAGAAAPQTQAAIREILLISRVDVAVLLVVVADMLMKPFS